MIYFIYQVKVRIRSDFLEEKPTGNSEIFIYTVKWVKKRRYGKIEIEMKKFQMTTNKLS